MHEYSMSIVIHHSPLSLADKVKSRTSVVSLWSWKPNKMFMNGPLTLHIYWGIVGRVRK
jgi:hypothetical protein